MTSLELFRRKSIHRCRLGRRPSKSTRRNTELVLITIKTPSVGNNAIFHRMAPGQKMYPRGTVKKIIKAHSNCSVSKNVDVLMFLDYALFMQTLIKEAAIESKQGGERGITARSVRKVTGDTLLKFKG